MPYTLQANRIKFKDPTTNEYITVDAVADEDTSQRIQRINEAADTAIQRTIQKGEETYNSIPINYTNLEEQVKDITINNGNLFNTRTASYLLNKVTYEIINDTSIHLISTVAGDWSELILSSIILENNTTYVFSAHVHQEDGCAYFGVRTPGFTSTEYMSIKYPREQNKDFDIFHIFTTGNVTDWKCALFCNRSLTATDPGSSNYGDVTYSNIFLGKATDFNYNYFLQNNKPASAFDQYSRDEIKNIQTKIVNQPFKQLSHEWLYDFSFVTNRTGESTLGKIQANRISSIPQPLPKNGLNVYINPKYTQEFITTNDQSLYRIELLKKTQKGFELASDYLKNYYNSSTINNAHYTFRRYSGYFPYAEGIYYTIIKQYTDENSLSYNEDFIIGYDIINPYVYSKLLNVTSGEVDLKTVSVSDDVITDNNGKKYFTVNNNAGNVGKSLISLLPLEAVDHIICDPKFSMGAQIYIVDRENKILEASNDSLDNSGKDGYDAGIYSVPKYNDTSTQWIGVNYIDFSKYQGKTGFILLCIEATGQLVKLKNPASSNITYDIYPYNNRIIGAKGADIVKTNVHVMYKKNINITVDDRIDPIIAQNLERFKQTIIDETFSHTEYKSPVEEFMRSIDYQTNVPIFHYSDHAYANSPLWNVTLESYVSAAKNPFSKFYRHSRSNDFNSTSTNSSIEPDSFTSGYGLNCTTFVAAALGLEIPISSAGLTNNLYNEYFDLIPFDYRDIKPGDVIAYSNKYNDGGHAVLVTSLSYVNGELFSINYIEGWTPIIRSNFYTIHSQYDNWENSFFILNLQSLKTQLKDKLLLTIARPKRDKINLLTNSYNFFKNYNTVTTDIMCNRGHKSIYGIEDLIYLTFKNKIETIYITSNNPEVGTKTIDFIKEDSEGNPIDPFIQYDADGQTFYIIDFNKFLYEACGIINNETTSIREQKINLLPGVWTIHDQMNETVYEEFYIAPNESIVCQFNTVTNNVEVNPTNKSNIYFAFARYVGEYFDENSNSHNAHFILMKKIDEQDNIFKFPNTYFDNTEDSNQIKMYFHDVYVVYKTDYGTYYQAWAPTGQKDPITYKALWNNNGNLNNNIKVYTFNSSDIFNFALITPDGNVPSFLLNALNIDLAQLNITPA